MKKLLITGLVVAVAVALGGVNIVAPVQAASAGDLIKMDGNPAVYYLGSDSKRYVFPNKKAYDTWYPDFSGVVTVSQSELESYGIGGNVTYRAGTRMVKITTDPKTYAVEPGGVLRWVSSEAIAEDLYGAEWWNLIDDVPDPFWVNYSTGSDITDATYPDGTLVKESGGTTTYYIEDGTKRPVADETAFDANNFNWDYLITASDLSGYSDGSSVTGYEEDIATVAGPGTPEPDPDSTGTLTVTLAADTPASTTVVENSTWVKYTKVNFSASGGDVIVDSVQIKRMGLAQDSNFSNVYLIDVATNEMIGTEKTLSSTHSAYVTKDFTVSNGTTKAVWLAATMGGTMQAGEMASLAVNEVNVKGDAAVSATLPITGNEMTMNGTIAIAVINPTVGGLATSATKPVGTTDYTFASVKLAVNSTEDVQVERFRFYQSGTAADSDVANLDLLVDGTVLSTVAEPDDKYVDFDLSSSPYSITKGQNKTFELRGDIVSGSSRTIDFDIYNKSDVLVKGKTYGFYRILSGGSWGTSSPYLNIGKDHLISTGTLTVSKATVSSTNVAESTTQEEIGAFYFNATGEPVIVTQVVMEVNTSTTAGELSNLTIYDEDGSVVAGPQDKVDAATDTVTFTDTFTVPTGIHTYSVKADLDSGWAANDTIRLDMANGPDTDVTAKGDVTGNAITPSPTSEIQANTITVKIGDLNVSTSSSPAAQTVTAGTADFIFANFVLDATQSGEDVKVTQLSVRHTTSAADIHNNVTGLTLFDGTTALNTPQAGEDSTTTSQATSTITLTDPLIITKGTAKTIVLKGDISGSAAADTEHEFSLVGTSALLAYGNVSGNSITEDITNSDGQTMTIATAGTIRMSNSGTSPAEGLIVADATNVVGVWTFQALYEDIEVEKLGLTLSGSSNSYLEVDWLQLYDGATKLGDIQITGANATITPSSVLTIDQNASKTLTLKAVTHKVGTLESGTSGNNIIVTVTGADVKGVSTGSTSVTKTGLDIANTNAQYIFASIPTVTKVNLSGMANGTQDLYKFTITADSKGDIGFYKASFALTTTSATITNFKMYEIDGAAETDLSNTALTASEEYTGHTNNAGGKYIVNAVVDTSAMAGAKERRTIGAGDSLTFVLRGDVTGWDANASIQAQLMGDSDAETVATTDTVDGYDNDNFIWSDLNYGYNTSSATETVQWVSGYKVFATTTQSF